MRSVSVSSRGVSRVIRFSGLVSVAAMLGACSVNSDRLSSFTNSTADTSQPIVDPLSPQGNVTPLPSDNYNRSVSGSSLDTPVAPASLPRGSVADASGTVTVNHGDTLYSISRANNVHVKDLIAANNFQAPYHLSAGQRIQLPRDNYGQTRQASNSAYSPQPIYATPTQSYANSGPHRVKAGETLYSLGRKYNVHPKKIASHNQLQAPYGLNVGQTLQIPSGSNAGRFPANAQKTSRSTKVETAPIKKKKPVLIDQSKPVEKKTVQANQPLPQPEQRSSSRFRWPLKGRVVSSYGVKPSGSRNDGINIAVPEGTSVRAAENGVVAYAGNELKGYGNLILVRHDGGWVTAYAHNKELFVKRGDRVSRGRVIAKSGSTGSVSSPQLHFEIRKGADAVNPMKYLSNTKVAGG